MPGSTFGTLFRVTTAGESHGAGYVVIIDGCPSGFDFPHTQIERALARRKPGRDYTSARNESDQYELLSGVYQGVTTGAPIAMLFRNNNTRPSDYDTVINLDRPGHADYSYRAKYGIYDHRGGGRASARETICRVAAGALAGAIMEESTGARVVAFTASIGGCHISPGTEHTETDELVRQRDSDPIACPDRAASAAMQNAITQAQEQNDSLGGIIKVSAREVPPGLGEPVFSKVRSELAAAILSIPATNGIEFGSGFAAAELLGSQSNDVFESWETGTKPKTNRHGGQLGGITTGEPIEISVSFKPPSSIGKSQRTVDRDGQPVTLNLSGRHDPCVVPRAVVIVEAMVQLVLIDLWLLHRSRHGLAPIRQSGTEP